MQRRILGQGRHTYEWIEDWVKLPAGISLGYTHGVAVDSQGRIIVFHQGKEAVLFLDRDGRVVKSWNLGFEKGAHGLLLRREGKEEFLYLTDHELRQIVKTTLDGEVVWRIDRPPPLADYADPLSFKPTNVAVAPSGDVYVADGYGRSWIHQYRQSGGAAEYLRSFGGLGREPGKLSCPHGILVDLRGAAPAVLVADRANVRLQTFSLDGKPLGIHDRDLRHPCHFDTRDGDLLIPDLFGRVTILDRENHLVAHLGDDPGVETRPGYPNLPAPDRRHGKFISPHAACWDSRGDIYVVEWVSDGRITKLRRVA